MALPFPSRYRDADKGEIYMATNKITEKSYVGQAPLFMGVNMQNWGGNARWVRHCRDATSEKRKSGKNTDINKAIRKYGKEGFELKILCTCEQSELDDMEIKYIKEFNTIEPNGYNMTTGGKSGKHSEAANMKKRLPRKNKNSEISSEIEAANNTSEIQSEKKKVVIKKQLDSPEIKKNIVIKNQNIDTELPKHLYAVKKGDRIVGYRIFKFKIDPETDRIVNKSFIDSSNPENELKKAIASIKELELEFLKNKEEYDKNLKMSPNVVSNLPNNVYPILNTNCLKLNGYYVDGLKTFDDFEIPKRNFVEFTNVHNLDYCIRFIQLVEQYNDKKEHPKDWSTLEIPRREKSVDLPKYIRETYLKGIHTGYRIDYFLAYDQNRKPIIDGKCFTSNKLTLAQKYDLSLAYLKELELKHTK